MAVAVAATAVAAAENAAATAVAAEVVDADTKIILSDVQPFNDLETSSRG